MALIAEYRISSVPRFAAEERDAREYDAVLGQRALWSLLVFQMVRKHRATVEIRYGSVGAGAPILASLRLHGSPGPEITSDLRQVEQLLPAEYQWEVATEAPLPASEARVARITRRIEYVDLPAVALGTMRGGTWVPEVHGAAEGVGTGGPTVSLPAGNLRLGFRVGGSNPIRQIPRAETTFGELQSRQFCLPLPGPISRVAPRPRSLFQGIQRAGFGIVSICLHPIEERDRQLMQGVALNFQLILSRFVGHLESNGFADERTLQSAFSRFALPQGYLFYVSLRVAAATNESAVGVANLVAESTGGALAFSVSPPTKLVPISSLVDPLFDIPSVGWDEQRKEKARAKLVEQLAGNRIAAIQDKDIADFIGLLPHVFSLQEAGDILGLPTSDDEGLPGLETHVVPPFTVPSRDFIPVRGDDGVLSPPPPDRVRIGMVRSPGFGVATGEQRRFPNHAWHWLRKSDLTKHALIVGSTGSGKTMTTLFLVRELVRVGVPVMVIEPVKTEYYSKLRGLVPNLIRLRLEGGKGGPAPGYIAFDPLRIPANITVARHCSYLKSCFEAAFSLDEFRALLLENGLLAYYQAKTADGCGLGKFTRGGPETGKISGGKVFPSYATFTAFFLKFLDTEMASLRQARAGDFATVVDAFRRRFVNLGEGLIGEAFRLADEHYVEQCGAPRAYDLFPLYLNRNTIIELDAVPDADHKALVMALLLSRLFEYRQAEDLMQRENNEPLMPGLRHFLIVEEAHRLLATAAATARRGQDTVGESAKSKAVQLFVDMLAEVRAFGQGLAIVEQIPTKIVPEAVKNTNLKIMLRLTAKDDREFLGEAMNFTEPQMRFVTNLKVDRQQINFVVFEEGVEQPLMLSLPLPQNPNGQQSADPYAAYFGNERSTPQ